MTTEREEALELAREVGLETRTLNSIDPDEIAVDQVIITDEIERLVRLAKQRGAKEQKRKDVEICRQWERQDVKADCCDAAQDECCMSLAALIEEQP